MILYKKKCLFCFDMYTQYIAGMICKGCYSQLIFDKNQ